MKAADIEAKTTPLAYSTASRPHIRQQLTPRQTGASLGTVLSERARREWKTSSSAIAEEPRDALSQLKSCQLLHNCTKNHIWLEGLPFHVV